MSTVSKRFQAPLPGVFPQPPFDDYELLDSGEGEKLERYGEVTLVRPDPQALWRRRDPLAWGAAGLKFVRGADSGGRGGRWEASRTAPRSVRGTAPSWKIGFRGASFVLRPKPFKHLGIFPEQAANWTWVGERARHLGEGPRLLNLFGYTGAASVLAARAGYDVTHVDASRTAIAWTKENAQASGLPDDALRLVRDDALSFARREVRRDERYAGILLDPPHHGHGPKGEKWQFEDHFASLLESCAGLLEEDSFLVLSTYAIGYSPLAFLNVLAELPGGEVESDELALPEEGDGQTSTEKPPRFLPAGFCARWKRGRLA